jgi:His/Glu/Gln/Arg/opine family amino acid ABC transporter permease subunit
LYEQYAFAIAKYNTDLLNTFNTELTRMKTDGRLQAILEKYLNKESTAAVITHNSAWQKFKASFKLNFLDNDRYLYLAVGFLITLEIAICAVLLGVLIGFIVAVIRSTADRNGNLKILNALCKFYLTVIRGTPVVVQLLLIYFVIFGSMDVDKVLVAIIAFGINSGAYVAEIIRGGIDSIDNGQMEAARSLGLSYTQAMIRIILPQALKNVLPALGNEFIVLLKETSVSGYIALQDLTKGGDIIRSQTYDAFLPLIAVALIYLAVVMLFSALLTRLERRLKNNE